MLLMDNSKDFDTEEEAIEYAYSKNKHVSDPNPYGGKAIRLAYNPTTGKVSHCLYISKEGLYYWEIY